MSTIDTSTWNPDPALNESIGDIPLNESASIAQTWQAIQMLMAAGGLHGLQLVPFEGATASADGASGLVPKPEAGDQDKFLKGDGTWDDVPVPNLGTASRAVQTDADGILAVSSVTATELGYLSGVTSAVQTQLNAKAADSAVVHTTGNEAIGGTKAFSTSPLVQGGVAFYDAERNTSDGWKVGLGIGGSNKGGIFDWSRMIYIISRSPSTGDIEVTAYNDAKTASKSLVLKADGTAKWNGQTIQTTSDERVKTPLASVPDEVLDAWEAIQWGQFQFLDAVGEKGASARLHLGLIAQRVKAVFEARGLDACAYGILCHDESSAREVVAEDGTPAVLPAVDMWSVRYAEALAMEAACQRRRADRLEARIAALEEARNG